MLFISITHPEFLQNEAGIINELFRNGLPLLHVRKPGSSTEEMEELLCEIPPVHHPRIVIHQHYELIESYSLKGIHLPETERRKNKGKRTRVISTSFHNTDELVNCSDNYEYVFLSPVYDSISKPGYSAKFKKDAIIDALSKTKQKVIALGGIQPGNIIEAHEMGFYGAASLGGVWYKDPIAEFKRFMHEIISLD